MIKLINNPEDFDRAMLLKSLNGKKMLAYLRAYGTDYDFCRFYRIENQNGYGFMFIINSTLIICSDYDIYSEELLQFRIEGSQQILNRLKENMNYQVLNRTVFEMLPDENTKNFDELQVNFNPDFKQVYQILSE